MSDENLDQSKLAYEIEARQLMSQKEDLRNVRNQASFSAAVSGLIAAAFGSIVSSGAFECPTDQSCLVGLPLSGWFVILTFAGSIFSLFWFWC